MTVDPLSDWNMNSCTEENVYERHTNAPICSKSEERTSNVLSVLAVDIDVVGREILTIVDEL